MNVSTPDTVRSKLLDRRARLVATIDQVADKADLRELLTHVDAALNRLSVGTYGSCEICRELIEKRRLRVDPLARYCSSHLTFIEQARVAEDHRDDKLQASFRALDLVAQRYPAVSEEITGEFRFEELPRCTAPSAPDSRVPAISLLGRMLDSLKARLRVFVHKKDHQGEVDREFFLASIVQSKLLPSAAFVWMGGRPITNTLLRGRWEETIAI